MILSIMGLVNTGFTGFWDGASILLSVDSDEPRVPLPVVNI